MAESFDFKKFVLSWADNPEFKNTFWILFGAFFLNFIFEKSVFGIFTFLLLIYVRWKYSVNQILSNAMKKLNGMPKEIGILDYILVWISGILVIFPFWAGNYFMMQVGVLVASIILPLIIPISQLSLLLSIVCIVMGIYSAIRMYLIFPKYLEKRDIIGAIKESWVTTKGKVIDIIIYKLRALWYLILKVWKMVLLAIVVTIILTVIGEALGEIAATAVIFIVMIVGAAIGGYVFANATFIGMFTLAALNSMFSKKSA